MAFHQNKYHAIRTEYNGIHYASKAEARRAAELDMLKRAGKIKWWIGQPRFFLGCPENKYVADFLVCEKDGTCHVEDVKGRETRKFKHDVKLWKKYGELPLMILTTKGKRWETTIVEYAKNNIYPVGDEG